MGLGRRISSLVWCSKTRLLKGGVGLSLGPVMERRCRMSRGILGWTHGGWNETGRGGVSVVGHPGPVSDGRVPETRP